MGSSACAAEKRREAEFLAHTPCHAFLHGETGSGKDVFLAETRRHLSGGVSLVIVPAGTIVDGLSGSQVFGHCRGSFSGADRDAKGLLQIAHGGILAFNDAELSKVTQAQLLSVVEGGIYWPVGGTKPIQADFRVFMVAHETLWAHVPERIRADLAYRLDDSFEVVFKPLREHMEDVPELAHVLLQRACVKYGVPEMTLSRTAIRLLERFNYPGNIRQLGTILAKAVRRLRFQGSVSATLEAESIIMPEDEQTKRRVRRRYASCADLSAEAIRELLDAHGSAAAVIRERNFAPRSFWRHVREVGDSVIPRRPRA